MAFRKMPVPTWLQAGWMFLKVVGVAAISLTLVIATLWVAKVVGSLILRSTTSLVMELNRWPNGHMNLQLLSAPSAFWESAGSPAPLLEALSIVLSLILGVALAVLFWVVVIVVLAYISDSLRK